METSQSGTVEKQSSNTSWVDMMNATDGPLSDALGLARALYLLISDGVNTADSRDLHAIRTLSCELCDRIEEIEEKLERKRAFHRKAVN